MAETATEGDEGASSTTVENKGRTIKDDSHDALEAALAKALDLATAQGRLDLVERILAQVERRGG